MKRNRSNDVATSQPTLTGERGMILVSLITAGYVGLGVRLVDIQVLQQTSTLPRVDNTAARYSSLKAR
ncbi:MAG: hypothetical protein CM1200mP29_10040 [Verrucomicrobiota bacterium]|nr:MAG: hypothetical protein CM1200mP29_10040 [Verrucomicrobiota bacterium]